MFHVFQVIFENIFEPSLLFISERCHGSLPITELRNEYLFRESAIEHANVMHVANDVSIGSD